MARNTRSTRLGELPFQIDTTARDYDSIRSALLRFVQEITPEWTDLHPSDPGVVLLEAMAYVADTINYQIDRAQNEAYLTTAQERVNVQQLLRLINYEMSSGSASSVPICVITDQDDVSIPLGTRITTQSGSATFEILEDIHLPVAGIYAPSSVRALVQERLALPVTAKDELVAVYGETMSDTFTSTGEAFQRFTLRNSPVSITQDVSSSLSVLSGGDVYTPAKSFLDADPTTTIFVYEVNSIGEVTIKFGDGVSGKVPSPQSPIVVTYRIGTGASTNSYGVNALTKLSTPIVGVRSIFNPVVPSGGKDAETISEAKIYGPMSLRALDRAITLEDFEVLAIKTPSGGVKACRAVSQEPYDVVVYVASEGQNPIPSGRWYPKLDTGTGAIGAVGRWLASKKPVSTTLNVLPPIGVSPAVRAVVTCNPSILQVEVKEIVKANLLELFENSTETFGTGLPLSRLIQTIENSRGVDYVNIQEFHRRVAPYLQRGSESALLSSTFTVSRYAETMRYGTYRLLWRSNSTFTIELEGYGAIRSSYRSTKPLIFNANQEYELSLYQDESRDDLSRRVPQITFSVTLGITRPNAGDVWGFTTDNYVGDLVLAPQEIIVPPITGAGIPDSRLISLTMLGGI